MTFSSPRNWETNSSPRADGSSGKTSTAAPARWPALDLLAQRLMVDHEPAGQVQEQAPGTHAGELVGPEKPTVSRPSVDMQGDDVGLLEELVEAGAAPRVAERELVGGVVEDDRHAERFGEHRELAADVAVAHDAEGAAAYLMAAGRRLVPDPLVHQGVFDGQPAGQSDEFGDGELDDAAGVGEGGVEDGDPRGAGRAQVDLVGADAERADRQQLRRRLENLCGDVGFGPDAEQVDALEAADQLVLVQRPGELLDVVAGGAQHGGAVGMDVFEQERARRCGRNHGIPSGPSFNVPGSMVPGDL